MYNPNNTQYFTETELPYFMSIPWHYAKVGNSIELLLSQLSNDKRNINYVVDDAKSYGIELKIEHKNESVVFHIIEIKEDKLKFDVENMDIIKRYLGNGNYKTISEIYKNAGILGNIPKLRNCLDYMAKSHLLLEDTARTTSRGGRPTKAYKLIGVREDE